MVEHADFACRQAIRAVRTLALQLRGLPVAAAWVVDQSIALAVDGIAGFHHGPGD